MDFYQFECFKAVAKYESITKAAHELCITQPALSNIILRLEKEVGIKLFDRTGKKILLNNSGKSFLNNIKELIYIKDKALQEIKSSGQEFLHISFASITNLLVQNILIEYLKETDTSITTIIANSDKIEEGLLNGSIDIAITSPPIKNNHIHNIILLEDTIYIYVSKNHRLASKEFLLIDEIKYEKISIVSEIYEFRKFIDSTLKNLDIKLKYAFEGEHNVVQELILNNGYIGFISQTGMGTIPKNHLEKFKFIKLNNCSLKRVISLSYKKDTSFSKHELEFKNFILDNFYDSISIENCKIN